MYTYIRSSELASKRVVTSGASKLRLQNKLSLGSKFRLAVVPLSFDLDLDLQPQHYIIRNESGTCNNRARFG